MIDWILTHPTISLVGYSIGLVMITGGLHLLLLARYHASRQQHHYITVRSDVAGFLAECERRSLREAVIAGRPVSRHPANLWRPWIVIDAEVLDVLEESAANILCQLYAETEQHPLITEIEQVLETIRRERKK